VVAPDAAHDLVQVNLLQPPVSVLVQAQLLLDFLKRQQGNRLAAQAK